MNRKTLGADLSAGLTVAWSASPTGWPCPGRGREPHLRVVHRHDHHHHCLAHCQYLPFGGHPDERHGLVAGEQLAGLGAEADPIRALFTLTLLVGMIMFVLGVLKLGSVIRFVSREVMCGFIFATALLIVLGQYKDLVDLTCDGRLAMTKWDGANTDVLVNFVTSEHINQGLGATNRLGVIAHGDTYQL